MAVCFTYNSLDHKVWMSLLECNSIAEDVESIAGFFWTHFRQTAFLTLPKPWVFSLSFFLEFWVFPWVIEFFSWIFWKAADFPLKIDYFAVFQFKMRYFSHISAITVYFLFNWVNFCSYFSKFCRNLEFFAWVLSYFLEAWVFFKRSKKKAWSIVNFTTLSNEIRHVEPYM